MKKLKRFSIISVCVFAIYFLNLLPAYSQVINECENWQERHPEWIFCDDFETGVDDPMVRAGRYFEHGRDDGDFIPFQGVGIGNSIGMRSIFQKGEVDAGAMKLGFGRNPVGYMNKGIRNTEDFREVYYRMYLRNDPEWEGNPAKLSRATVFTQPSVWTQAMIAHLWSDSKYRLLLDPASGVNANGEVITTKYNDFDKLRWLGNRSGVTTIFDGKHDDWICIEHHVKLNDPGEKNGIQEFWINGNLEARLVNLDFVSTYTAYAINAIFFENYWNSGSIKLQERYFDNIVVSTERIGCLDLTTGTGKLKEYNINVYPNPTTGTINFYCANQSTQEVRVFDITGNNLITIKNHDQKGTIDISHLNSGIYFLHIASDKNVFTCKIIKE
jgi:hypothetical protein